MGAMKKASSPRPTTHAPHEVRIIGGLWKRSKLPVADRAGLRPTPARVRETLFNWLGQDLRGWRCVDAFAGTGALGFEAASRGAAEVVINEQDAGLVRTLGLIKDKLRADAVRIERGDGVTALQKRSGQGLDVVFLDPPFADATGADDSVYLAALRAARQCLKPEGLIYLEAPRPWGDDELAQLGLQLQRQGKAGMVAFHLLRLLPGE
jgi:16S rRNA (guanine966-N2)-methyltransferase